MNANEIIRTLGETDGQNGKSWDPGVLAAAAESCIAGGSPHEFEGRPEMADEAKRFAAAWLDCQRGADKMTAKIRIKNLAEGDGYEVLATVDGRDFGPVAVRFAGSPMIYDDVSVSLSAALIGRRGITAKDILAAAGVSESDCDMIAITPSLT